MTTASPPSARATVRRHAERARYEAEEVYAILDEGLVAHVGTAFEGGGVSVIPMAYGRDGDVLYLHGAPASGVARAAASGAPLCVTVTILDGLVLASSPKKHSMNFRSVVVHGRAREITDDREKERALDAVMDHIVPGRRADVDPPSGKQLRGVSVFALPLDEASAKVRAGGPADADDPPVRLPWTGVLPLRLVPGPPVSAPGETGLVPDYLTSYRRP
jgi:nitroimidazol reductase NimA-like FMN-containing flavoprotein (pyridoxamine 5'-phosphate oxidase superfamily)